MHSVLSNSNTILDSLDVTALDFQNLFTQNINTKIISSFSLIISHIALIALIVLIVLIET
jgi:hypothetical protein